MWRGTPVVPLALRCVDFNRGRAGGTSCLVGETTVHLVSWKCAVPSAKEVLQQSGICWCSGSVKDSRSNANYGVVVLEVRSVIGSSNR